MSVTSTIIPADKQLMYPINPDVTFKKLPFFDVISILLRPSSINSCYSQSRDVPYKNKFLFFLSPKEIQLLSGRECDSEYTVQVRTCLMETTCQQYDCFPDDLSLTVNGNLCIIPRRNDHGDPVDPGPIDITQFCFPSPITANEVIASTTVPDSNGRVYTLTVQFSNKVKVPTLISRLHLHSITDYNTIDIIKNRIQDGEQRPEFASLLDNDMILNLKVSLLCPLSQRRIESPCRSNNCLPHIQCFDAESFLKLNENKLKWICPLCQKPAPFDSLVIDKYFQQLLCNVNNSQTIVIVEDGSYYSKIREPN